MCAPLKSKHRPAQNFFTVPECLTCCDREPGIRFTNERSKVKTRRGHSYQSLSKWDTVKPVERFGVYRPFTSSELINYASTYVNLVTFLFWVSYWNMLLPVVPQVLRENQTIISGHFRAIFHVVGPFQKKIRSDHDSRLPILLIQNMAKNNDFTGYDAIWEALRFSPENLLESNLYERREARRTFCYEFCRRADCACSGEPFQKAAGYTPLYEHAPSEFFVQTQIAYQLRILWNPCLWPYAELAVPVTCCRDHFEKFWEQVS